MSAPDRMDPDKVPVKHFLLYWGCWGGSGHYLWARDKMRVHDARQRYPFSDTVFDGCSIFLPQPERVGTGALTHVVRGDLAYTVLAWWGSPWDSRGQVNAAIIASGWDSADDLWLRFSRVYESLAVQLARPTL